MVERYWSWVCLSASITWADVEGPEGKEGNVGGRGDSMEENDEDEEVLLIDSMAGLCRLVASKRR